MLQLILQSVSFGAVSCDPNSGKQYSFFGFPHWWQYIRDGEPDFTGKCIPKIKFPDGIWAIVLSLVSMLLFLAGVVAVFSIIVSGAMYMLAGGNPERAASARKRLFNSIIGLVIVVLATPIVAFLGNTLG